MHAKWIVAIGLLINGQLSAADNTQTLKTDQTSPWEDQLKALDQQIQALLLQSDSYRHKALDAEEEAQQLMLSDFTEYSKKIKEAENYEELARNSDKQMKLLEQERQSLIKAHPSSSAKK